VLSLVCVEFLNVFNICLNSRRWFKLCLVYTKCNSHSCHKSATQDRLRARKLRDLLLIAVNSYEILMTIQIYRDPLAVLGLLFLSVWKTAQNSLNPVL
jgi:hypothetical protein